MTVLVLGASGMLGNAMLRVLSECMLVYGSVRSTNALEYFPPHIREQIIAGVDVESEDALVEILRRVQPSVVINCVGLVKQLASSEDPLRALPINSLLPHRMARLCALANSRLVHISTDCVFSGIKGNYREEDISDATDLYGKSKYIGEVDYPNAITLRTSIIGHELIGDHGLIGWFLSQNKSIKGFSQAIFSGVPTVELARVVRDAVLPKPHMRGVYHVASEPISKFELLKLVAEVYGKDIEIIPDDTIVIDRSLNADRFREAAGYTAPSWPDLIKAMYEFQ